MTNYPDDSPRDQRWGEWLRRAGTGDRLAFALLAAELKPYLLARWRTCSLTRELFRIPDDAEDAIHDTLLIVWEKRTSFDPRRSSVAWLWIIARNCAVNVLRRRSRHRAISLHDRDGHLLADLAIDPTDPSALVSGSEEKHQLRRAVARALWSADPRVRRAWRLRFRKGQPYAVIAHQLGVPQGTVATWLHRLKQGLRRCAVA